MSASSFQALDYLEQLPVQTHRKLYEQPSTVLAIFRCMLPHLAKSIVMALLYMPSSFPAADLDAWFRAESSQTKRNALSILEKLHIIVSKQDDERKPHYELYMSFASSLRQALEGSGSHRSFGVPSHKSEERRVSVEFLDKYSQRQWENILFYLVGGTVGFRNPGGQDIGQGTKNLLHLAGFYNHSRITQDGFTFVLRDTNAQVWSLLVAYLRNAPQQRMSETDILNFLFMLGSLELGQDYSTATLSATQLQMLEDLAEFGIIYRPHKSASTFYPTRLAVTLTSDAGAFSQATTTASSLGGGATSKGFIIVETNYRIYAYTNSLLQIAILSLFTHMRTRFPNLVSGKITRKSIGKAISYGITSAQVIEYLETHAHPQMQKKKPFLPPTVMDQIRLWEYERERMETSQGFLMKGFGKVEDYKEYVQYAKDTGVLVWQNDKLRMFFIDSIEQVGAKIKRDMQRAAARA
ncbi:RNA polymerase II transcription factor B subunit 2 [Bimuria novae-zelandiae CBS 107.79]|uniref:RNA polymerase II transcription factor B subunit 2 n=1 Tax=Bimuria novae-zelandiae CBS 107.79 TaxID=1447943 RepID=A0A6A5VP74_9PLEO|nr:RNA polymerase II transcription factor B subunit 2 [Bimuria novae-zelandiae CBS 107.79]